MAEIQSSCRKRRAVKPLAIIGRGFGATAKGIWRLARGGVRAGATLRKGPPAPPLASLTAVHAGRNYMFQDDEKWTEFHPDDVIPESGPAVGEQFWLQLPSLQLPKWLMPLMPPANNNSSSSSSSNNSCCPTQFSAAADVAAAIGSTSSSSSLSDMYNPNNCFPMAITTVTRQQQQQQQQCQLQQPQDLPSSSSSSSSRQLLTVGCRHWGNWWDGRGLLRVKIYDFAIYIDGQQASTLLPTACRSSSSSSSSSSNRNVQAPLHEEQQQQQQQDEDDLASLVKSSSSQVGMSLVLKAARDVPLHLLSEEYEKVLRRRLSKVPGTTSADEAALQLLLKSFSDPLNLPAAVKAGGSSSSSSSNSVRKGAMITFEKHADGTVVARMGCHILGTVQSPKVAEALFDLYLGDQPVSRAAKNAAAATLHRIAAVGPTAAAAAGPTAADMGAAPYYLPQGRHERITCQGGNFIGKMQQQHQGGFGVQDLAACMLHLE